MRPTIWFASTGNNKMEDTEQLTAKVEQVTITEQPAEQKVETTEQKGEVKAQGKKQKKPKAEKPKQEKKEQAPVEDDGPRLFAQVDIRVGEIVECWKVKMKICSILHLRISIVKRSTFVEKLERLLLDYKSSCLLKE